MLPVAMLMNIGTSPGQTFAVSVFNEPMRESLGLSHSMLSGAYLVASLLAAVPLMTIGRRMDRHGLKIVSIAMATSVGVACFVVAGAQSVVALTIGLFLLRACGQGGLSMAAGNTLGMWFNRRLGLASGIAGVGMSAAIAVTPPIYLYLIHTFGWRSAYALIGCVTMLVLLPLLFAVYRNSPASADASSMTSIGQIAKFAKPRHQYTRTEAMQTASYWVALGCSSVLGFACTAVFFNLVPLFKDSGLTAAHAASIFPTMAMAMAAMQIQGGLIADRVPLKWLQTFSMTIMAVGMMLLASGMTLWTAHIAAALIGGGQGLMGVVGNSLWPRYFGRMHLGAIRSSVWTAAIASCAIGPFVMGVVFDLTGSYTPTLLVFLTMFVGAGFGASMWGGPPPEFVVKEEVVEELLPLGERCVA
jgi:MFS family permease